MLSGEFLRNPREFKRFRVPISEPFTKIICAVALACAGLEADAVLVSWHTAAVFRRECACPVQQLTVERRCSFNQPKHDHTVLPVVAEVVDVLAFRWAGFPGEVGREFDASSVGRRLFDATFDVFSSDGTCGDFGATRYREEAIEVTILPAAGGLDGIVEVVERRLFLEQAASPHTRLSPDQSDLKVVVHGRDFGRLGGIWTDDDLTGSFLERLEVVRRSHRII